MDIVRVQPGVGASVATPDDPSHEVVEGEVLEQNEEDLGTARRPPTDRGRSAAREKYPIRPPIAAARPVTVSLSAVPLRIGGAGSGSPCSERNPLNAWAVRSYDGARNPAGSPGLPVARDVDDRDSRVRLPDLRIGEAEPVVGPRPGGLDPDVRLPDQVEEDLASFRGPHVEAHRQLVPGVLDPRLGDGVLRARARGQRTQGRVASA